MLVYKNFYNFLLKYYKHFISLILSLCFAFGLTVYSNMNSHFTYLDYLVNNNVTEYEEVDLTHICNLTDCNEILLYNSDNCTEPADVNLLEFVYTDELRFKQGLNNVLVQKISEKMYYYKGMLMVKNKTNSLFVSVKVNDIIYQVFNQVIYIYAIIFFIVMILLYNTFKREKREALFQNVGNEAILANKSMVMITENINHELNTPIEIIDNKMAKIHKVINEYLHITNTKQVRKNDKDKKFKRTSQAKLANLERDFEFIKISIEQMFAVLNKMKNFKSLRYSNGDKTLYDILDGAFRIISISSSDFNYTIDDEFKLYRMNSPILKNVDLLNVIINHLKNSLEANADFIIMSLDYNKGKIKIKIKDNGNGIPKNLLKDVFKPNFSSKSIGDSIRGNGMYLNYHIVQEAGGHIEVEKSSDKGTIVTVTIPCFKYTEA